MSDGQEQSTTSPMKAFWQSQPARNAKGDNVQGKIPVLIVAEPGRLRDGLRAVVLSVPWVRLIDLVDDEAALLQALASDPMSVVLLDAGLPREEAWRLLFQSRLHFPETRYLLLTDSSRQQRLAESAGALSVQLNNLSGSGLKAAIVRLFSEPDCLKVA